MRFNPYQVLICTFLEKVKFQYMYCHMLQVTCTYPSTSDTQFIQEVEAFATSTIDQLSATAQHLQKIIEAQ